MGEYYVQNKRRMEHRGREYTDEWIAVIMALPPLPLRKAYFARNTLPSMMYRLVFHVFTPHSNVDGSFFGFSLLPFKPTISIGTDYTESIM